MYMYYRSYKYFDETLFRIELAKALDNLTNGNLTYDEFKTTYMEILNKFAPEKKKIVRGNNSAFMNTKLSKAFMVRSKWKNRYNNNHSEENKAAYKNIGTIVYRF